jgi:hypothetical protein
MLPGVELKEVYISLGPIGADGKLGNSYYPAERSLKILVSGLQNAGIY